MGVPVIALPVILALSVGQLGEWSPCPGPFGCITAQSARTSLWLDFSASNPTPLVARFPSGGVVTYTRATTPYCCSAEMACVTKSANIPCCTSAGCWIGTPDKNALTRSEAFAHADWTKDDTSTAADDNADCPAIPDTNQPAVRMSLITSSGAGYGVHQHAASQKYRAVWLARTLSGAATPCNVTLGSALAEGAADVAVTAAGTRVVQRASANQDGISVTQAASGGCTSWCQWGAQAASQESLYVTTTASAINATDGLASAGVVSTIPKPVCFDVTATAQWSSGATKPEFGFYANPNGLYSGVPTSLRPAIHTWSASGLTSFLTSSAQSFVSEAQWTSCYRPATHSARIWVGGVEQTMAAPAGSGTAPAVYPATWSIGSVSGVGSGMTWIKQVKTCNKPNSQGVCP